ncbi:MAG: KEOPS complex subunit Pcc1, partial [Candidatus Bathyarchaeia archaeon]
MSRVLGEGTSPLWGRAEAEIEIEFPLLKIGQIIAEALRPELENPSSDRSKVELVVKEEGKIALNITATDTSALRAALNSYLRWIAAIAKTLNILELM